MEAGVMSAANDLEDARRQLVAALDMDAAAAERVADLLERQYGWRAIAQPREVVLRAAAWAARRLNALPAGERERPTPARVLAQLDDSDCPLCATGGDDGGGSAPTRTPVVAPPVRVPEGVAG
jgi:hypothetical protein